MTRMIFAALALIFTAACASAPTPTPGQLDQTFLQVGETKVHYEDWGNRSGPAILSIHGASSHTGEVETSMLPLLQANYRVVAYDRPGHGYTRDRPKDAEQLRVQAEIAAGVIEGLGLERPIILGHSYGGGVALRLAVDRPDLVGGLVLLAPASHPFEGSLPFFFDIQAAPVIGPAFNYTIVPLVSGQAARAGMERVFSPVPVPEGYIERANVAVTMLPSRVGPNAKDMTNLVEGLEEQYQRYGEITVPVSIIAGREDAVVPIAEKADPDNLDWPNARLVLLDGVGHMPQVTEPEAVLKEIEWVRAGGNR